MKLFIYLLSPKTIREIYGEGMPIF